MKLYRLSILSIAVLASASGAQQAPQRYSEITTGGRGEVRVTPDKAVLVLIVENRAPTASDAAAQTARGVTSTIAALKAAGVAINQITNGGYTVTQDYEIDKNTRKPKGFIARNAIRVDVPEITNVGRLIDTGLASGATQITPIQFSGPNMPNARRTALGLAVAEAKRDAEALATAAGGTLGQLISLSTNPAPIGYPQGYETVMVTASGMAPSTVIAPNDIVVSGIVTAKWEFLPRQ